MLVSFGVAFYLVFLLFSPARALLEVFEVYQPVSTGHGSVGCNEEILLMDHVFGYSYGEPYVGRTEAVPDPISCSALNDMNQGSTSHQIVPLTPFASISLSPPRADSMIVWRSCT